jgi:hypothetical protein
MIRYLSSQKVNGRRLFGVMFRFRSRSLSEVRSTEYIVQLTSQLSNRCCASLISPGGGMWRGIAVAQVSTIIRLGRALALHFQAIPSYP